MDSIPKTRREKKKTAKEKAGERYSAKHARLLEQRIAEHKPTHRPQNTK